MSRCKLGERDFFLAREFVQEILLVGHLMPSLAQVRGATSTCRPGVRERQAECLARRLELGGRNRFGLKEKIRRRQRLQAGELDLEIGASVAVDVALDDGLVVGRAARILLEPA